MTIGKGALRKFGRRLLVFLAKTPFRNNPKSFPSYDNNSPSLQFEFSVLYTVILGTILIFFSGLLYLMLFYTLHVDLDGELKLKAQEIAQSINTYLEIKGHDEASFRFAIDKTVAQQGKRLSRWWIFGFERRWFEQIEKMDLEENLINFVSPDKQSLAVSRNMSPELLKLFMQNDAYPSLPEGLLKTIKSNRLTIRIFNARLSYNDQPYMIQVGAYEKPIDQVILTWLNSTVITIPFVLLLTSFTGRVLTRRILGPVEELTEAARKITYQDLSARVKTQRSYKELDSLAAAFNEMIDRLQKSFQHIEEFSYHAAHELKTPLTIIKGEAEVTLLSKRDVKEYEEVLRTHLQESDRMLKTVEDLLYLGRLDYQPDLFHFEVINLSEFLSEIYQQTKILSLPRKIKVSMHLPKQALNINGDPLHLRRLFFNLIDNALKYTPVEGHVDIFVKHSLETVTISIVDTGKGISAEALPYVFKQFFRADETIRGTGLGLSIVKSIAKMHSATVNVESHLAQGTTVHVIIPRAGSISGRPTS